VIPSPINTDKVFGTHTKHQDLCFQRGSRSEKSDQPAPDQAAELAHRAEDSADSLPRANRIRFATGTAVDLQGRALDALRKGAQGPAQSMQQQMGRGSGLGRPGRFGQSRAQQDTDPLGRPLRGHEYGDDSAVKVPGEIDVQRARRIIDELRRRFGDFARPQEELDYIERLLKNY